MNFEHLYPKGQLRLPTEAEGRYAFRQSEADITLGYSLFIKGKYQVSHGLSPAPARYFLSRPATQHCIVKMNTSVHQLYVLPVAKKRCMLYSTAVGRFVEKFSELMRCLECIDMRSPEVLRQRVRNRIYGSQHNDPAMRVTPHGAILDTSAGSGS